MPRRVSPDSDLDQMPDGWESYYGLDPLLDDANGDLDGDSLTNYEEYLLGLNPASSDSDGDTIPDIWELEHGMNPIIDDSAWDADGDGISNLDEYENGINPLVPNAPTTNTTTGAQLDLLPLLTLVIGFAGGMIIIYILMSRQIIKIGSKSDAKV